MQQQNDNSFLFALESRQKTILFVVLPILILLTVGQLTQLYGEPDQVAFAQEREPITVPTPTLPSTPGLPEPETGIQLRTGWNLMSLPYIAGAGDAPADALLASIEGGYDRVFAYDGCTNTWRFYDPTGPSTLDRIDATMGLWIQMNTPGQLILEDAESIRSGEGTEVLLCPGWNLIGYPSMQNRAVVDVLASTNGQYERVLAFDPDTPDQPWKFYDPRFSNEVNTLTEFRPGLGYWIKIKDDVQDQIELRISE